MWSAWYDEPMTRRQKQGEVPFVIKEAGKAVERDVKPTINLLGKLLFENWPRPAAPLPPQPRPDEKPGPVRLPASHGREASGPGPAERMRYGHQIVIRQVDGPQRPGVNHNSPPAEPILDAEIIEEDEISPICETCGGAGRLGRTGHEVPCPACNTSSR